MKCDGRDEERIRRGVDISRKAFDGVDYPRLDITNLSVDEAVCEIIRLTGIYTEI